MNKDEKLRYKRLKDYIDQELANVVTFFSNPHDTNLVGDIMDASTNRILRYSRKMLKGIK